MPCWMSSAAMSRIWTFKSSCSSTARRFLIRTHTTAAIYQFVPYKYGAFSFTSYADRRRSVERSILADNDQRWILTDLGRRVVNHYDVEPPPTFVHRHRNLRGDDLIAKTYRDFPYFATRSEIADRVLHNEPDTLSDIANARPEKRDPGLFTIGYEDRSLESYPQRTPPSKRYPALRCSTERYKSKIRFLEDHAISCLSRCRHSLRTLTRARYSFESTSRFKGRS